MPKEYVRKRSPVMSACRANGIFYPRDVLERAWRDTVWDRNTESLTIDHVANQVSTSIGKVDNLVMDGDDLLGDIHVYDLNIINKLESGLVYGISPELEGEVDVDDNMVDFKFLNFSMVFNPAVKTTLLYSNSNNKKRIRTRFLSDNTFDKEILIEQAVEPTGKLNSYFVDERGNVCRSPIGRSETMEEKKGTIESSEGTKVDLSEIKNLITQLATETSNLKSETLELRKKLEEQEKDEPKVIPVEETEPVKEPEAESAKEPSVEPVKELIAEPEVEKPAEDGRQALGEDLSKGIVEVLSDVNPEYATFVKSYLKEHDGEESFGTLMKLASSEWKVKLSEKKKEEDKIALSDNRQTMPRDDISTEKKEIKLSELDVLMARELSSRFNQKRE